MKLSQLLSAIEHKLCSTGSSASDVSEDPKISNIVFDSRRVGPGSLFVCLTGSAHDGHDFAHEAILRGASAIVVERDALDAQVQKPVPIITVPDTRTALADLAQKYYDYPTRKLKLIGVTGTNGKTTIVHLLSKMFNSAGSTLCGQMGTLGMQVGSHFEPMVNTTPESLEIQRNLAEMANLGARYAAIEVSSHALAMGRVRGCEFETAIFSNLTHDHLDFHQSFDDYRSTKKRLFTDFLRDADHGGSAVLNADDLASVEYAKATKAKVVTYGLTTDADVHATDIEMSKYGSIFTVRAFSQSFRAYLKLPGLYNVQNALAMIATGLLHGVNWDSMLATLKDFRGVPGRFEVLTSHDGVTVIVDYAHNPDALANLLRTTRAMGFSHVYCVFGCEGDRDKLKRPVMARIALQWSDTPILTLDNTRSEDPDRILNEMTAEYDRLGVPASRYYVIPDRREAIYTGLMHAKSGDCLVVAGKGHETVQILGNQSVPFNDKQVVFEYWGQFEDAIERYGL